LDRTIDRRLRCRADGPQFRQTILTTGAGAPYVAFRKTPVRRRKTQPETMLKTASRNAGKIDAVRRIKDWTRERFSLGDDVAVMVAEVACGLPGCPPIETIVTFWTAPETRHAFKAFKPVAEVTVEDLPPYWMKNAIITESGDLSCC
jgi:nitrate reductase delta subunit